MPEFDPNNVTEKPTFEVPAGKYSFDVFNAKDDMSKNQNEKINLELQFDVGRDKYRTIWADLVFHVNSMFRVKEFCIATGILDKFQTGSLSAEDCEGLSGQAHIALGKPKPNTGKSYMEVQYYCEPEGFSESPAQQEKKDKIAAAVSGTTSESVTNDDDDIPF